MAGLKQRMLEYEQVTKTRLTKRTPVIIRLDGVAFHTLTKKFERPFDNLFIDTMQKTTRELCKSIQGCVLGYTQSDEITLVLVDYQTLDTQCWFDNEVLKLTSVSASIATRCFNKFFKENVEALKNSGKPIQAYLTNEGELEEGVFDSRCFNIPKEEVTNAIYYRQQDCKRNSILSFGQSLYSHKQLMNLKCPAIVEKCRDEKGKDWDALPTYKKLGTCIKKSDITGRWIIDTDIPLFVGENRHYIDDLVLVGDE